MTFVIDTSVTMAWCFEDEATEATDAVLARLTSEEAVVPGLWRLEVTNVLLIAERRRRITEAQSSRFVSLLEGLPIRVAPPEPTGDLLAVGRRHGLSAYDAAYLALAERTGSALATLDRRLAEACRTAGVETLATEP